MSRSSRDRCRHLLRARGSTTLSSVVILMFTTQETEQWTRVPYSQSSNAKCKAKNLFKVKETEVCHQDLEVQVSADSVGLGLLSQTTRSCKEVRSGVDQGQESIHNHWLKKLRENSLGLDRDMAPPLDLAAKATGVYLVDRLEVLETNRTPKLLNLSALQAL